MDQIARRIKSRNQLALWLFLLASASLWLAFGVWIAPAVVAQPAEPTPLPLYALPDARFNRAYTSGTMTLYNEGSRLIAANMLSGSITIINVIAPHAPQVEAEIAVGGDPRSVAVTADNSRALVTNRRDGTVSVVGLAEAAELAVIPLGGALPYAIVTDNNETAYVSLMGSDEVVLVNLITGDVQQRIPVAARPAGLALWGDFLYVTHFWNGAVSLIYLPQGRVIDMVQTGIDTTASQAIELDITRGVAYLPQTRSNTQNRHLTFDTTVFPIVNVLEMRDLRLLPRSRVTLDTADRPVNMPFAIALDRFRNWLYVANSGSNNVSVIDLATGLARANIEVGANPRGILLNRDNNYLFVHNVLDNTVSVIETSDLQTVDVLPISNLNIPVDLLFGAQMFHSAVDPRLSIDRWISCANCHFDGLPDGQTWQGFPGGPRNTPPLYRLFETSPYNWSATWDELHDVEWKIRGLQGGTGLIEDDLLSPPLDSPNAGLSPDMDTLAIYLISLTEPPNPNQPPPEQVERGAVVFDEQGCAGCHVGPAGTNLQTADVGTGDPDSERDGGMFDTPSLRYLWLSAPYFHDGSAPTLHDVFTMPGDHQLIQQVQPADIDALVAYLLNWR